MKIDGVNMCAECESGQMRFLDVKKDEGEKLYCDSPDICKESDGFRKAGELCVKMTCDEFAEYAKSVSSLEAFATYVYTYNGECVDKCPDGASLHNSSNYCMSSCQFAEPYLNEKTSGCSTYCESGAYTADGSVMTCEDVCPKYYVLNSSISEHEQK